MQKRIIIAGGGIVGLATAYQLKRKFSDVSITLIEKENDVAQHQTGHNSGVIHSGLYYKPKSLKAENCLRGYKMLLSFCEEHHVPHELTGKIVVASSPEEIPLMENLYQRGVENGLTGIKKLRAEELTDYEPHVQGVAGLWVPQTGIVDYKRVAQALKTFLLKEGVQFYFNEKVEQLIEEKEIRVCATHHELVGDYFINCAGLYSDKLARLSTPDFPIQIIPFRGEYYELKKEKEYLVKNLIYPVPNPAFPFLGVHFTRMAKGGVEAGPNAVLAFRREGYKKSDIHIGELVETLLWPGFQKIAGKYWQEGWQEMVRSFSKKKFTQALQKLVPAIQEQDIVEAGAGVRAQACSRDGNLLDDFSIQETAKCIHVCNAPSPAATSSLSIGLTIAERIK